MCNLKYLVIDVDGTMTDGGIYYDNHGNELKKFCTRDAAGFFAAKASGIKTVVLTGRECEATTRRLSELKVDYLIQGIKDKKSYLEMFMEEHSIHKEEIGYIGDDLNDLAPMQLCGYVGCPGDSCSEIKEIANYVSKIDGGHGAVRDIIEQYLRENNLWINSTKLLYGIGV